MKRTTDNKRAFNRLLPILVAGLSIGAAIVLLWTDALRFESPGDFPDASTTDAPMTPEDRELDASLEDSPIDEPHSSDNATDGDRAAPLLIALEEGTELGFYVSRSHYRSGRFEGGDETQLDYTLRVQEVRDDGSIGLNVTIDRIFFKRAGRAPMQFDSAEPNEGEATLLSALRDFVGAPISTTINADGKVRDLRGFPEPTLRLRRPPMLEKKLTRGESSALDGPGLESLPDVTEMMGSNREVYLKRLFALMLRFVVSPEIVRADLQTIFAAGIQGSQLAYGEAYAITIPDRSSTQRERRGRHPGPVPIYNRDGRKPTVNPLSGGGKKGRGEYVLEYLGSRSADRGEIYDFELVQSFGRRKPESNAPKVGSASYRTEDGLLEHLAYNYEMRNNSPRDSYYLKWEVEFTRR